MLKAIRTLYLLYLKRLKIGQVWRFQTDKPEVYLDYRVLALKEGWVQYQELESGIKEACPILDFKVGLFPIKQKEIK